MTTLAGSPRRRPRIALILPTDGYRTSAFLDAAAALDIDVVVATNDAPPLATEMEDSLVIVDFDNPNGSAQGIAAAAQREPLDAVVGVDDQGILTASLASEILGLPHNPADAVAATRNKSDMRGVLKAWSVPQPRFRLAPQGADIAAIAVQVGLPCVIKPLSLSASTGVIRVDTPGEADEAANRIRTILASHNRPDGEALLVEQFVAGHEVSIEGLMVNGELQPLAMFDKPDPLNGPYFEETIYVTPSRLPDDTQHAILKVAADACRALGLRHGPVHAEVRVDTDAAPGDPSVWVIEVAARSIGGLCSRVLKFGADITLEEIILRNAIGLGTAGLKRSSPASGVMMIPIPRSGVLTSVDGLEAARGVDGVVGVEVSAALHRPIQALPEGGRYLGFIFARGETASAVEAALRRAHGEMRITITAPDPLYDDKRGVA